MDATKMMAEIAEPSEFGRILEQILREQELKEEHLTGWYGLPKDVIHAYLKGKRKPVDHEIEKLCFCLKLTPYAFMPEATLTQRSEIRFGYQISPIDIGFRFLWTVNQFRDQLRLEDIEQHDGFCRVSESPIVFRDLNQFDLDYERAKNLARDHGWEGDFRNGPFVMPVLKDSYVRYAFVFKQDNNGSTFVLSPVPLTYLEYPQ